MAPKVMTVGAHDVSGAAGIGVEAGVVTACGGEALGVVTGIVSSVGGTLRVLGSVSSKDLARQVRSAGSLEPGAVKVGFLPDAGAVSAMVEEVANLRGVPVVADPVLWWGTDGFTLPVRALGIYCAALLPHVTVLTADAAEAAELLGERTGPHDAVRGLLGMGPRWVVLKGVAAESLSDMVQDLVSDGQRWYAVQAPRPTSAILPGVGAIFATALATHLARGVEMPVAAGLARDVVNGRAAGPSGTPA